MVDQATKPIVVRENAGTIDLLTSLARQLVYIMGAIPILLTLLGTRDVVGIIAYLQSSDGVKLLAAAGTIFTAAYGLYKSRKRGAQVATVAADRRVPDSLAQLK